MAGYTDLVFHNYKLFIEGIEVPFKVISIRSVYGELPRANIEIMPFKGMEIINRFYAPKVHIFYADAEEDDSLKLLFSGFLDNSSYSKATSAGRKSLNYACVHRYDLLSQITIAFTDLSNANDVFGQIQEGVVRSMKGSTSYLVTRALRGITGVMSEENKIKGTKVSSIPDVDQETQLPTYLDDDFHRPRFKGMAGSILNIWNQFKARGKNQKSSGPNQMLEEMYVPLMEHGLESQKGGGLRFFDRMSGIPAIEDTLSENRTQVKPSSEIGIESDSTNKAFDVILPPSMRAFSSQVSKIIATITARDASSASGELTSYWDMIRRFTQFIRYQYICLASPARIDPDNDALDFLITPRLTSYFSPTCNVIFPNMFDTIQVTDSSSRSPTRTVGKINQTPTAHTSTLNFRSPPSVRNSILDRYGGSLTDTTTARNDAIGKYEYGRGVIPRIVHLPEWVNSMDNSVLGEELSVEEPSIVQELSASYVEQYGSIYDIWNPINANSFKWSTLDLQHFRELAESRNGQISGGFNPYPVPGLPMDILDSDEGAPCYHAFCTSVVHTITSNSAETSIGFNAALTYEEMANYNTPSTEPWLSAVLKMTGGKWVGNAEAKAVADEIYQQILKVNCVDLEQIYNFERHELLPFYIDSEGMLQPAEDTSALNSEAQETNLWKTYQGNLQSAKRDIETLEDIERDFGLKFIKAESQLGYIDGFPLIYYPEDGKQIKEFGQSLFLDYTQEAQVKVMDFQDAEEQPQSPDNQE